MLNWFWTIFHKRRLRQYEELIAFLETEELENADYFPEMALVLPISIFAAQDQLEISEAIAIDPIEMPMSDRLKCIRFFAQELKRLNALEETQSVRLLQNCRDILEIMHLLRFYQADTPKILPEKTEEVAGRLSAFLHRLHRRGIEQSKQVFDDQPAAVIH